VAEVPVVEPSSLKTIKERTAAYKPLVQEITAPLAAAGVAPKEITAITNQAVAQLANAKNPITDPQEAVDVVTKKRGLDLSATTTAPMPDIVPTEDVTEATVAEAPAVVEAPEIIDVAQVDGGSWMITVDGQRLGDSKPQPTREAAEEYARTEARKWGDLPVVMAFDEQAEVGAEPTPTVEAPEVFSDPGTADEAMAAFVLTPVEEEVAAPEIAPEQKAELDALPYEQQQAIATEALASYGDNGSKYKFYRHPNKNDQQPFRLGFLDEKGNIASAPVKDRTFGGLMEQVAGLQFTPSGRVRKSTKKDKQARARGENPVLLREEVEATPEPDPELTLFQQEAQKLNTRMEAALNSGEVNAQQRTRALNDIRGELELEDARRKKNPAYEHDATKLQAIARKHGMDKSLTKAGLAPKPQDEQFKTSSTPSSLNRNEPLPDDLGPLIRAIDGQAMMLRTSAGPKPKKPMSVKALKDLLLPITRNWTNGLKPIVVDTYTSLPAEVQDELDAMQAADTTQGFTLDGRLYIIADNIADESEAKAVLFHEALGHIGLRAKFQDKLDDVLAEIYAGNANVKASADAWLDDNPDQHTGPDMVARATEEVLSRAQEGGPIKIGAMKKLIAAVRQFGRMLGIRFLRNVVYSDADVRAILASAAMEVTGKTAVDPQSEAAESMEKAQGSNNAAIAKLQESNAASGIPVEAFAQSLKYGHNYADFKAGIEQAGMNMSDQHLTKLLKVMPVDGIVGWFDSIYKKTLDTDSKDAPTPLRRLVRLIPRMTSMRSTMARAAGIKAEKVRKFINKHGSKELANAMHISRGNRVDPETFGSKTLAQVYADDAPLQLMEKAAADPTNTPQQKGGLVSTVNRRKKQIRQVYGHWVALGEQKGGQEIYSMVRKYYATMNKLERTMRDKYINEMDIDEESKKKLLSAIRKEMEDTAAEEDGDAPTSLYPQVYFPYMRHGDFFLSVQKPDGKGGRQFFMFDTAKERNKFLRDRAKRDGRSMEDPHYFKGNSASDLRPKFEEANNMLQQQFAVIDKITATDNMKYDTGKYASEAEAVEALKQDLKDELYQVYLTTRPEASLRKRYIHAENVTGYSSDVLRNFVQSANQYSAQLAKLQYGKQIETAISSARDSLEGMETSLQATLGTMVSETANRAREAVTPPERSQLTSVASVVGFVWFLSAPATAIIQLTTIPMRVLPNLTSRYGEVKGWETLLKYSNAIKSFGVTTTNPDGTSSYALPTMENSSLLKNDATLARAFRVFRDERETFGTLQTEILRDEAKPLGENAGPGFRTRALKVIGAAISTTERMSREVTALATFELEYARLGKEKPDLTPYERFTQAIDVAADTVNDTVGNYSEFNKPPVFKGDIGRLLFQFKTFSAITFRFFIGTFREMIIGDENGNRVRAIRELTGVLGMGAMFFGMTGLPLFSLAMWMLDLTNDMFDDDEDDAEKMKQNPYTAYNSEYQFRYEWLPKMLGQHVTQDGESNSLVNMFVNGPLSELSDVNIGSRTSYNDLWFRDNSMAGDGWTAWAVGATIGNVPILSLLNNAGRAADEYEKGEMGRALEAISPAFARNVLITGRYASEGAKTRSGDTIMSKDQISDANLAAQVLGFQPTRLAQMQQERSEWNKIEAQIKDKRTALLRRMNLKRTSYPVDREAVREIGLEMVEFNKKYPIPGVTITADTIDTSFKGFTQKKELQYRGKIMTKKTAPYAMPGSLQADDR